MEAPPKLPPAPSPVPPRQSRRFSRLDILFLSLGIVCAVVVVSVAYFSRTSPLTSNPLTDAFEKVKTASQDKAVLNNARQLAAAADQHYLETSTAFASRSQLIGLTNYIKSLNTIAGETYPVHFTHGVTITITGIGGARTMTYVP